MKRYFTYAAWLLLGFSLYSTAQAQHQHGGFQCGTTVADQLELKTQMLEHRRNREEIMAEYLMRRSTGSADSISYVPMVFHVTSDQNGNGGAPIGNVLCTVCKLNEDYRDQNIQFYIQDIRFINNNLIFNHGVNSSDQSAQYFMSIYKVPGVLNVFVGRGPVQGAEFLAYYTRFIDVMYTFGAGLGCNNPTMTHEVGHYFTLPHTFFGWEGQDYANVAVNGKAPTWAEKMVRSGGTENCQFEADGFCDTPPDYVSDRHPCPFTRNYFDADSVRIVPMETNFMSYFNDNCINTFTPNQKEAMLLDFLSRGYDRFPALPALEVTGTVDLLSPGSDVPYQYFEAVRLSWSTAPGADRYRVTVERMLNNIPVSTEHDFVTMDNTVFVPLAANRTYRMTVQAINGYDVCNDKTTVGTFTTGNWVLSTEGQNAVLADSKIFPNPGSRLNPLAVEITVRREGEVNLTILNSLGQEVAPAQVLSLVPGTSTELLDVSMLPAGLYLIQIQSAEGRQVHKFILND